VDWNRAIEINKAALMEILGWIVAVLSVSEGAARLPLQVYQRSLWRLHKVESAVRRLIVIAARDLVVLLPPHRPMPAGLVIAANASSQQSRLAFQLFDARQTFSDDAHDTTTNTGPGITLINAPSPRELFLQKFITPPSGLSTEAQTRSLHLRLAAAERALAHLTREAKRLARWREKRRLMNNPKFTEPMRPGPPPGINRNAKSDIDRVLRECHNLAWHCLREDTS
jgi:hypothetical protein